MALAHASFHGACTDTAFVPRSTWLMQTGCSSAFSAKLSWLNLASLRYFRTSAPITFRTLPIPDTPLYATTIPLSPP